jgi:polysaccharide biosynthesis protein PslH
MKPPLLYLTHRIPYPPNKGDKVRSYHLLKSLADRYRVFLGTFVDDPADQVHVATLDRWCESVCAVRLQPSLARLWSLRGLLSGEALSVTYYRSRKLLGWVRRTVASHGIVRGVAFSGPMAAYLSAAGVERQLVDFCDVDSLKWSQYADRRHGLARLVYRREGRALDAFERVAAASARASTFVTEAEAGLFRARVPQLADRVLAVGNGVDTDHFDPAKAGAPPYAGDGPTIVFMGAMDYWPNVDAVTWFAREVFPSVLRQVPGARFVIVGMNPASSVRALESPSIIVTGTVADVRPWVAHASLVVAPLRLARGIQNKVLEAMAMARHVVISSEAAAGFAGVSQQGLRVAASAGAFLAACLELLADPVEAGRIGAVGRANVVQHFGWSPRLQRFHELLED